MAELYLSFRVFESLSLLRCQLVKMSIYILDASEFGDKLPCSYLADALHSRHIVRRVSAYGQDLHHLLWSADAEFFTYLSAVDDLGFASGLAGLELENML